MSEDLVAVEEEWREIVVGRDVARAEQLLADDFILSSTGGVGDRLPREAWLEALPTIETRSLECDVLDSRAFGDVGVVRARLEWEAAAGERDLSGSYIVADVFRREAGRWRAAWRISTRLTS